MQAREREPSPASGRTRAWPGRLVLSGRASVSLTALWAAGWRRWALAAPATAAPVWGPQRCEAGAESGLGRGQAACESSVALWIGPRSSKPARVWPAAEVRLLIQQASWCRRAEPGRLGSPGRGSECRVIDQFSLSVHTGPGQRSGGDSPGGHGHRACGRRGTATLCTALGGRHPPGLAGPVPPLGIPAPHPSPCARGISS